MLKRLILPLCILVALGSAAYAYVINRNATGPFTGLSIGRDIANRRPIGVILDNYSPDARPQTGLAQASLIFETLAEGGITRFLAIYQEHDAAKIGPVRSTRLYFNSWAAALGIIFAHDGGNVDALQQLPSLSTIYNEDAGRVNGPFWRTSDRQAPHNEYTSTFRVRSYASSNNGSTDGIRMSLSHKPDAAIEQRPAQFALHLPFSFGDYNVTWQYDRTSNTYRRFMGGVAHVDPTSGRQLTAKNVVVMYTHETPAADPFTPGSIHLRTEGTGATTVYEDGVSIPGTWSKSSLDGPLTWLDGSGNPIKLNRGTTWIEVLPGDHQATTS